MDDEQVLAHISSLCIDWSYSAARIREELMRNGCTGISEKRIKRLKAEQLRLKISNNGLDGDSSVKEVEEKYENEDQAAMELRKLHEQGKLKGRNFEKALPNVASALRSGKLNSDYAADVLTSRYLASKEPIPIVPGTDISPQELMFTHLVKETFSLGQGGKFNDSKAYEFLRDLQSRFNRLMESSLAQRSQLGGFSSDSLSAIGANMFSSLQEAYDETCSDWEKRLDRHFKKGAGYFQRTCSLYQCSEIEFSNWLTSKLSHFVTPDMISEGNRVAEDLSLYHRNVTQAAQQVEKGDVCWQCNIQQSIQTIKRCSRCKCANYCSVECQKADWKKHKVVCTTLRDQRKAVNSAFPRQPSSPLKAGVDKEKRNPDVEAMVKYWLAIKTGGSLDNFYQRLDRIIANEWWLGPKDSDTEEPPRLVDKNSIMQFLLLCFYMAKDGDNLSLKEFLKVWCPSPKTLMTRASFLFTYKVFSMGGSEASRNAMYSMMREHFRKASQTIQLRNEGAVEVD